MAGFPCPRCTGTEQAAQGLAQQATDALLAEVRLTPKPGLVDRRGSGVHADLSLALMERSAHCLSGTFYRLAVAGTGAEVSPALRVEIGRIGRVGEREMLQATGGVNTHRGAIWALGLLVCAAAMAPEQAPQPASLARIAARLAALDDPLLPQGFSKGRAMCHRYRVPGAREQAQQGFPVVIGVGLKCLQTGRERGVAETSARIDALLAMMAQLDDTCLLARGGWHGLQLVQQGARATLAAGGYASRAGQRCYAQLERAMRARSLSPGGAADLLAATLLLDALARSFE